MSENLKKFNLFLFENTNIDTLILGCTHYSIIEKEILNYFNNSINIITSFN